MIEFHCLQTLKVLNLIIKNFVLMILIFNVLTANAQVNNIDIVVPHKDAPGEFQIAQMQLTIQTDTEAPISFSLNTASGISDSTPNLSPGDPLEPHTMVFGSDIVRFYPPDSSLPSGDPRRRNYRLIFSLGSDFNPVSCQSTMTGDETWNLSVNGGAMRIVNTCLISLDENTSMDACDGNYRIVPSSEAFSEIGGLTSQEQSCRFGVEAMLVLDRSGSMNSKARPAEPTSDANRKIVSLRNAVDAFTTTLENVRSTEAINGLTVPNDRVGVVIFDNNADSLSGISPGLNLFNEALPATINTQLSSVTPSGSTSIGDGLILGGNSLGGAAGNVRRLMLLMSDGKQNTDQRLSVIGDEIVTHGGTTACPSGSSSPGCDLVPNFGNFSVCSVTVGTSSAVEPAINQALAEAGDCFYLNSEDDASDMSMFFINVLQNFLATNTWQTLFSSSLAIQPSDTALSIPVTSTTQSLLVIAAPKSGELICLRVAPPGENYSDEVCDNKAISYRAAPPRLRSKDMRGDWKIKIETRQSSSAVNLDLVVLADDHGTHATAEFQAKKYAPLEPIDLKVNITEFNESVEIQDVSKLTLNIAKPDQTIGDIMAGFSTNNVEGMESNSSPADAAIATTVEDNGTVILNQETSITLNEVQPGVYDTQFTIEKYGHTDLTLTLFGESPRGGKFIRQINQTIYINAVPDAEATEITTKVIQDGDSKTLDITVIPKTVGGYPVGPGWHNYYWLTGSNIPPFKLKDNLDGSYSGYFNFNGNSPPDLSLHFIADTVSISDDVPASHLPSTLDNNNELIPNINNMATRSATGRWTIGLHLGTAVPQSNSTNAYDNDLAFGIHLEYLFNPQYAIELYAGQDNFSGDSPPPDLSVNTALLDAKMYLPSLPQSYLGAGFGYYDFDSASSEFGYNVMLGGQFELGNQFSLDLRGVYHTVDSNGTSFNYANVLLGIVYRF